MKLLQFVGACTILASTALHSAPLPIYRINYGNDLSKSMTIQREDFNELINASKTLTNLHDENDTTVDIALDITPASMRKFITLVPNIAKNVFNLRAYQDNELGEMATLADFLKTKVFYDMCLKEFAQRITSIKFLQQAINKQWVTNWLAALTVPPQVKADIAQKIFEIKDLTEELHFELMTLQHTLKHYEYSSDLHTVLHNLAYSPDGKYIASALNKTIKIWDAQSGNLIKTLPHGEGQRIFAYSPDGRQIASNNQFTINIWDAQSGNLIKTLTDGSKGIYDFAYSPDGNFIASTYGKHIAIWDAQSGNIIHKFDCGRAVLFLAYSPDGKYIAAATPTTISIWDLSSSKLVKTLEIPVGDNEVYSHKQFSYSPDGKFIASLWSVEYRDDKILTIWDTSSWKVIGSFKQPKNYRGIVYSPDGKHLLMRGSPFVLIWTLPNYISYTPKLHDSDILAIAFSPDGNHIATKSVAGNIRIWQLYKADPNDLDSIIAAHIYLNRKKLTISKSQLANVKLRAQRGSNKLSLWQQLLKKIGARKDTES